MPKKKESKFKNFLVKVFVNNLEIKIFAIVLAVFITFVINIKS